jgi:hypothetical protein
MPPVLPELELRRFGLPGPLFSWCYCCVSESSEDTHAVRHIHFEALIGENSHVNHAKQCLVDLVYINMFCSCHHLKLDNLYSDAIVKVMRLLELTDHTPCASGRRRLAVGEQLFDCVTLAGLKPNDSAHPT